MTKKIKIQIRMTKIEKEKLLERCRQYGFSNISEYIRVMALKGVINNYDTQ